MASCSGSATGLVLPCGETTHECPAAVVASEDVQPAARALQLVLLNSLVERLHLSLGHARFDLAPVAELVQCDKGLLVLALQDEPTG